MMKFDISKVPFTRYGSYLAFSILPEASDRKTGLYLRSVRGPATGGRPMQELLHMDLIRADEAILFETHATFTQLTLASKDGRAELCMPTPETVRIRLNGVSLCFQMPVGAYDNIISTDENHWCLTVNTIVETKIQFTALQGTIEVDAPWDSEHSERISITLKPDSDQWGEFAIDESTVNWLMREHLLSFDDCVRQVENELGDFTEKLPSVPSPYADARSLAGYILWSCVVAPAGHLTRPSIFASKNGMIGSWSWDHCFHALALAGSHPHLAWDQMMTLFDQQDESGALPDLINDRLISWSFCKPPVHGWILNRMLRDTTLLTTERLNQIYEPLSRWTNWWFVQRDDDGDGILQCNHGNDGGWDNSTVFAVAPPIESPEISAYLVLQMEVLAHAAQQLGKIEESTQWLAHAEQLTKSLLAHFWRNDHFIALQVNGHVEIEAQSLLLYMPLLLGKRLPQKVREQMIAHLKVPGEFLTAYGFATENLNSPLYRSRGYWRGPIWGAPTLILCDALIACDEIEFANDVRQRFVDLVAQNGFAENFDAQTGQGYHDFHFSWTAGIWLTLAHELGNISVVE